MAAAGFGETSPLASDQGAFFDRDAQMEDDEAMARRLQSEEIDQMPEDMREPLRANLAPNDANRQIHRNMVADLADAREGSPRILCLYMFFAVAEIIATVVILALHWSAPCDKPLRWFLLVFTGRFVVTLPLTVYKYHAVRRDGRIPEGVQSLSNCGSLLVFVWFVIGQFWTFGSSTCHTTAPGIYTYALTLIIIVYVSMMLPLLCLVAMCICLPCVLLLARLLAEPEGASDSIIENLPTRKYDGPPPGSAAPGDAPSCCICMVDYEFDDELRTLPCDHEFHTACVDQWLRLKKECPLCRRDVTLGAPEDPPV